MARSEELTLRATHNSGQENGEHASDDRDLLTRKVDFHVSIAVDSTGFDQVRSGLQRADLQEKGPIVTIKCPILGVDRLLGTIVCLILNAGDLLFLKLGYPAERYHLVLRGVVAIHILLVELGVEPAIDRIQDGDGLGGIDVRYIAG